MCEHVKWCDFCGDAVAEREMFRTRSETFRVRCISQAREHDDLVQRAACAEKEAARLRAHNSKMNQRLTNVLNEATAERAKMESAKEALNTVKKTNKNHKKSIAMLERRVEQEREQVANLERDALHYKSVEALDEQVKKLSQQVERLQAINNAATVRCVNAERESTKKDEAVAEIQKITYRLQNRCHVYSMLFQMLGDDPAVRVKVKECMDVMHIDPGNLVNRV